MKTTSNKVFSAYPIGMVCCVEVPTKDELVFQIGVVYEHYKLGDHHGVSIILSDGSYDGFSESCLETWSVTPLRRDGRCSDYKFENVGKLANDFMRNRFQSAFVCPR
ncbi:hypothetical protein ACRZ5S_23020 (plasmid) [Vibrio scophthalmi]|uniref:hypothetical protein n=1 Tax=Vibrio scophthalmi TaxID=45658 RepID=UPI003EBDAB2B